MRLQKAHLIRQLASEFPGTSYAKRKEIVDKVLGTLKYLICSGGGMSITLSNFGSFTVKNFSPRPVRNLTTGETFMLGHHRRIQFIPTPGIKKAINPKWLSTRK